MYLLQSQTEQLYFAFNTTLTLILVSWLALYRPMLLHCCPSMSLLYTQQCSQTHHYLPSPLQTEHLLVSWLALYTCCCIAVPVWPCCTPSSAVRLTIISPPPLQTEHLLVPVSRLALYTCCCIAAPVCLCCTLSSVVRLTIRQISLHVQRSVRVDVGYVFGVKTNPYLKIKYIFEIFHQPAVKL